MHVYGIIAIADVDLQGDVFSIVGINAEKLLGAVITKRPGAAKSVDDVLGIVHDVKYVLDGQDTEYPAEHALYAEHGFTSCVMVSATIHDANTIALLKGKVPLYFGVEGIVLEKEARPAGGYLLKQTLLKGLRIVPNGVHLSYRVNTSKD